MKIIADNAYTIPEPKLFGLYELVVATSCTLRC